MSGDDDFIVQGRNPMRYALVDKQKYAEMQAEIERLQASLRMTNNQDSWMGRAFKLEAVLRPLLKHYLNCYDGLEDQLAKDARAALEGK